jgi:2-haloacid dehalogenase
MRGFIVFDVNETLLDLGALDPLFARHLGDAGLRRSWFAQVLQSALVATVLDSYRDFGVVAEAALEMVAARSGVTLGREARREILAGMRALPAHPDVPDALRRLREYGWRLATLTNSSPPMVESQLANAGLEGLFEAVLSVDKVRRFKPARAVYEMAARELGEDAGDLWLVAAHDWDTTGALSAGWKAAFVQRPGMVLGALDRTPQLTGRDLAEIAEKLTR